MYMYIYIYMYMLLSHSRPRWSRVDVDVRMGLIIWLQLELGLAVTIASLFPSFIHSVQSPSYRLVFFLGVVWFALIWASDVRIFASHCD